MSVELLVAGAIVLIVLVVLNAMFRVHTTYEWNTDLLYVNGRYKRTLAAGRHRLFRPLGKIDIFSVRSAEQWWTSGLTDVSSAERLPFRAGALVHFRVTDPRGWHLNDGYQRLQKATFAALVEAVGRYRIEELMADRGPAGAHVAERLAATMADCEILGAAVDSLQLPPETRRLFIEVEKARLEGLAALERARGEQAALRSLANAARLLKDNPDLLKLRLLQTVGAGRGATLVLGQDAVTAADGRVARPNG